MRTMIARWLARNKFQDDTAEVWREYVHAVRGKSHQRYRVVSRNGSGYIYWHGWRWYVLINRWHP